MSTLGRHRGDESKKKPNQWSPGVGQERHDRRRQIAFEPFCYIGQILHAASWPIHLRNLTDIYFHSPSREHCALLACQLDTSCMLCSYQLRDLCCLFKYSWARGWPEPFSWEPLHNAEILRSSSKSYSDYVQCATCIVGASLVAKAEEDLLSFARGKTPHTNVSLPTLRLCSSANQGRSRDSLELTLHKPDSGRLPCTCSTKIAYLWPRMR